MSIKNLFVLGSGSPPLEDYIEETKALYKNVKTFETYSVRELENEGEWNEHESQVASEAIRPLVSSEGIAVRHYKCLDKYGSGRLEYYADALRQIKEKVQEVGPGVINSSLGVTLPHGAGSKETINNLELSSFTRFGAVFVDAYALHQKYNIPVIQDIENLSQELRDMGCIFVSASGNEGSSEPSYPASSPNHISIGSAQVARDITSDKPKADMSLFSNRGCTFVLDGQDEELSGFASVRKGSGTSFSSPRFAGLALKILQAADLNQGQVVAYFIPCARRHGAGPVPAKDDVYGWGSLDYYYREFV